MKHKLITQTTLTECQCVRYWGAVQGSSLYLSHGRQLQLLLFHIQFLHRLSFFVKLIYPIRPWLLYHTILENAGVYGSILTCWKSFYYSRKVKVLFFKSELLRGKFLIEPWASSPCSLKWGKVSPLTSLVYWIANAPLFLPTVIFPVNARHLEI